jgi:RNA polymerase sigma factor for flagellar operon FliA
MVGAYARLPSWTAEERDQLVLEHLPQVRLIAGRIHERLPKQVPLDDLISAGVIGLMTAIDNFDPSRGVKLRTFAEHKIRGYILNSLAKTGGAPRSRRKAYAQVQRAITAAGNRLGRAPESEDIAQELGIALDDYYKTIQDFQSITLGSIDAPIEGGDGESLARYVLDPDENTPQRALERRELQALVLKILPTLPETERVVLNMYYLDQLNLREIASVMDLHITRVSQIKTQAILRLRGKLAELWPGRPDV